MKKKSVAIKLPINHRKYENTQTGNCLTALMIYLRRKSLKLLSPRRINIWAKVKVNVKTTITTKKIDS